MLMTIQDMSFSYGRQSVLQHITADLHRGEVVALVGANGSGKTTLMQLMLGDLRPRQGRITPEADLFAAKSIAYLPDKPPLYPDWSVRELLLRLAEERKVARAAVDDVVARCALQAVQHQLCRTLSHGYRQRVSLAQALLHKPKLLFMDEPMNGLDDAQRQGLRRMIVALAEEGMTVVLSLHDLEDVTAVAQRVWYLKSGRLFDLPLLHQGDVFMWAVFSSLEAAQKYDGTIREGCACGFSLAEYERYGASLWRDPDLQSLGRSYPAAALWARMAACQ